MFTPPPTTDAPRFAHSSPIPPHATPFLPTSPTTDAPRVTNGSYLRLSTCKHLRPAKDIPGPSTPCRLPRIRPPEARSRRTTGGRETGWWGSRSPSGPRSGRPGCAAAKPPENAGAGFVRSRPTAGAPAHAGARGRPFRKRPGATRPRIWTGGRKHGRAMRHRVRPEARWIEAENSRPHRRGAASPIADYPLEARASPAPLRSPEAAGTAVKPYGESRGGAFARAEGSKAWR